MEALPPVPGFATIVNVTGRFTVGFADAEIEPVGSGSTVTVTLWVGAAVVVVPVVLAVPAVAVTLAVLVVVRTVVAIPLASVVATPGLRAPLSVVNVTGIPAIKLPPASL